MPAARSIVDFTELLTFWTQSIVDQQARLEDDYRQRLEEFLPLLLEARARGCEELLLSLAPALMTLSEVEIETTFRFAVSREGEFALGVRPLNLGYARRYAYSGYVENSIQLSMKRVSAEGRQTATPTAESGSAERT